LKKTIASIAALGYFGGSVLLIAGLWFLWHRTDPEPVQPIAFLHSWHAGQLRLPCTHCHAFVERSRSAGPPPLETCMGCHKAIATGKPEIKKLTAYYNEKRPLQWARVYAVKEFIYFSHQRHIKAGVECGSCHGNIQGMKLVRRVNEPVMGWCVSCHRVRGAPRDCATCHR
jgi:hypothetical protein